MEHLIEIVKQRLSPVRFQHTLGVMKSAEGLARMNGVSSEKAKLAGLLHDYVREMEGSKLRGLAQQIGISDEFALRQPELLHAPVGAFLIQRELGIDDQEIAQAISSHTVGRRKMSKLEQILYVADMIEPNRNYPGVEQLREAVAKNLKSGLVAALEHTIRYLLDTQKPIDLHTIEARNYYIMGGD